MSGASGRQMKIISATTSGSRIFVVCDGMGGHAAGEVASQIAVETVLAYFRDREPAVEDDAYLDDAPLGARLLADAVRKANDAILGYAEQHKNTSGMGTTLVAARFCRWDVQHR